MAFPIPILCLVHYFAFFLPFSTPFTFYLALHPRMVNTFYLQTFPLAHGSFYISPHRHMVVGHSGQCILVFVSGFIRPSLTFLPWGSSSCMWHGFLYSSPGTPPSGRGNSFRPSGSFALLCLAVSCFSEHLTFKHKLPAPFYLPCREEMIRW